MIRKELLKHGKILTEYKREPDKNYNPYRKGSYYCEYETSDCKLYLSCGDVDRYNVYKYILGRLKNDEYIE